MRLVLVVTALVLLAGCANESSAPEEPEKFQEAKATDTTGVIRGLVVDATVTPVPGVTITTTPGGLETITDGDGLFLFEDLEPQTYFLQASGAGIEAVQASTTVEAGVAKPPVVRIQVTVTPPPVPSVEAMTFKFVTSGSAWVGGVGGIVFTDMIGDSHYFKSFEISGNTTWVQTELVWEASQLLAENFYLPSYLAVQGGENLGSRGSQGPSPLLTYWDDETIVSAAPLVVGQTIYVKDGDVPVGLTVDQQLDLYVHAFHHFTPDAEWRFSANGAPKVPSS